MKVLLVTTTYKGKSYIWDRFISRVKELTYPVDVLIVDNSEDLTYQDKLKESVNDTNFKVIHSPYNERSKISLTNSQNLARQYFLDGDYTHFFSLESDLIPPKDIVEQLLESDKDVISGWYYITRNPRPCLCREWTLIDMKFAQKAPLLTDLAKNKIMKVFSGSFGCSLIKRKVLEEIKFKVYQRFTSHADTWFYFDCERKGFEVFVDTNLLIPHFQDWKWDEITKNDEKIEDDLLKLKPEGGLI